MQALITAPFHPKGLAMLEGKVGVRLAGWGLTGKSLEREELIRAIDGVDVVVSEMEQIDGEVLARCPGLRAVGSTRGTPTNVDVPACTEAGIPVIFTPGRNAQSVAELTIALAICLSRKVLEAARYVTAGQWVEDDMLSYVRFRGQELCGRTMGIVGFGAIGQKVARLARAFSMDVLVFDPYVSVSDVSSAECRVVDLPTLLSLSDFVTLHCPANPHTQGLIGERELSYMKKSAYLINTSRGSVVDERALARALSGGLIAGAALDVFSEEPLPAGHAFEGLENVVLLPHIGGATHDVVYHHSIAMAEDLLALARGARPKNLYNQEVYSGKEARPCPSL